MLFGPGAGGGPTASAVVGDIISIVNTAPGGLCATAPATRRCLSASDDVMTSFYVRLHADDRPGVLAKITAMIGEEEVSIRSVVQKGRGDSAELVMVFHPSLKRPSSGRWPGSASWPKCKARPASSEWRVRMAPEGAAGRARVVLVPDGMADEPLAELGGRTPLQAARTPFMDAMARRGGRPRADRARGHGARQRRRQSERARLRRAAVYTGRSPLEAASIGV